MMHKVFKTEERAKKFFENVSLKLKEFGYFFGIMPDSAAIWFAAQKSREILPVVQFFFLTIFFTFFFLNFFYIFFFTFFLQIFLSLKIELNIAKITFETPFKHFGTKYNLKIRNKETVVDDFSHTGYLVHSASFIE